MKYTPIKKIEKQLEYHSFITSTSKHKNRKVVPLNNVLDIIKKNPYTIRMTIKEKQRILGHPMTPAVITIAWTFGFIMAVVIMNVY